MPIHSNQASRVLELMGLDLKNCRKASIHFTIDDFVTIEAEYVASVEDIEGLKTEVKKYRLERIED